MTRRDRERLRSTFDQAAELYDRARPRYPAALFDDLAALAGIGPGSNVLEIGPGTGQATVALAERGCRVVAVELGAALAAVARRNLAQAGYERWDPETPPGGVPLRPATDIPSSGEELDGSRRFGPATFRRYEWDQPYTTASSSGPDPRPRDRRQPDRTTASVPAVRSAGLAS
jgi:SAM-dependent methyltransferase